MLRYRMTHNTCLRYNVLSANPPYNHSDCRDVSPPPFAKGEVGHSENRNSVRGIRQKSSNSSCIGL
jgi:hypothetical protein